MVKKKRKNTKKKQIKKSKVIKKRTSKFKVKNDFKIKLKQNPLKQYKQQANMVTYWTGLVVITTCNLFAGMFLIPFLLILPQWPMYLLVVSIALIFGLLFNFIIRDIDVERHHHILAITFIPIITIINLFLMTAVANKLDIVLNLNVEHSPYVISLLYAIVFLLPYAFSIGRKKVIAKRI
tara:strand:- start:27 stop:566 length:540 start_codon:yes stop_codon:yes gene_type:complete